MRANRSVSDSFQRAGDSTVGRATIVGLERAMGVRGANVSFEAEEYGLDEFLDSIWSGGPGRHD